jgi:hypothetical protein
MTLAHVIERHEAYGMSGSKSLSFRIYLRRDGRILRLFKISRTSHGLYTMFAPHAGMPNYRPDHRTYHEDGKCFDRLGGRIIDRKQKQPLAGFTGAETQLMAVHMFLTITPEDLQDEPGVAKPKDIVLDLRCPFAVEMIISEQPLQLAEIPTRLNRVVRDYTSVRPIITIEAFEMADNIMPSDRYPPLQQYELGKNWLSGEGGRLP